MTSSGEASVLRARLATSLGAWLEHEPGAPGAVVAVARLSDPPDRAVVVASGVSDLATGARLGEQHAFRWASVTKAATAIAALRCAERALLDLDAPITDILSAREAALHDRSPAPTPRQLLAHQGGVPDFYGVALASALDGDPTRWAPAELPHLAPRGDLARPGTGFASSDTGFGFVGLALERRTERSLGAILRAEVLDPLGMDDTRFEPEEPVHGPGLAHHYLGDRDVTALDLSFDWAGGGLVGPVRDLLRLARAIGTGELLAPASAAAMTAWSREVSFPRPSVVVYDEYGLGVGRLSVESAQGAHALVGATGSWGAFAWACPSADVALAGTVNAHGVDRRPLFASVLDALAAG